MSSAPRLDHPLCFVPHMRDAVWGGHRLAERLPWVPVGSRLAEAWLVSGHPAAETPVAHGPLAGWQLSRLIGEFGTDLVGTRHADTVAHGRFPILLKLLDVDEWLSVQVHPAQGDGRRETFGKTEMWIILAAEPDAELILGLKPGTTLEDIQQAGPSRALTHWLQHHQVRAGDTFFVPAGQVHALGPGITVLEVQETSDTTWRMYDWDRPSRPEQPRPLHWARIPGVFGYGRGHVQSSGCPTDNLAGTGRQPIDHMPAVCGGPRHDRNRRDRGRRRGSGNLPVRGGSGGLP